MRWLALLGVGLLAALVLWLAMRETPEPAVLEGPVPSAAERENDAELASPPEEAPVEEPARAAVEPQVPAPEETVATAEETPALAGARVHGRFVLPGDTPAIGVDVRLHGWGANSDRILEFGEPEGWVDPTTTTDSDGRFEIRLDPPQAYQFTLDANLAGHAEASWRWSRLLPDEDKDVGTAELVQSGTIVARVVDADGETLSSGWRITATSARRGGPAGRDATRVTAYVDAGSGIARLEGVLPGPTKVKAYSRIANWIDGPTVDVVAGAETEVGIPYSGPDNSRRIVVVVFVQDYHTLHVEDASIWLVGPDGERRSEKIEGSSQSYAFDDLEPGRYTVGIDDPRFEPWSQSDVEPGNRVNARLHCNAAFALRVVDGATGEAIEDYGLRVRLDGSGWRPNVFSLRELGDPEPTGGVYAGIPPIELALIVSAEGYSTLDHSLGEVLPDETRAVTVELFRGTALRGRVVESDGRTPVPGVQVQLLPRGKRARHVRPDSFSSADDGVKPIWTETDGRGRFELLRVPGGDWSLFAIANSWLVASLEDVQLAEGEERDGVLLELPPASTLDGRLRVPDGASCADMSLFLKPSSPLVVEHFFADAGLELELDAGGGFRGRLLPPGEATLVLRGPRVMIPHGFSSRWGAAVPHIEVATLDLPAGRELSPDIDLRDRWFGSIRVRVTRDGTPLGGQVVEARSTEEGVHFNTGAATDAGGVAVLAHLVAGEWAITVRPPEGAWVFLAPDAVPVAVNRESELHVQVHLVEGSVRIVDASGTWLRERAVLVFDPTGAGQSYTTDAEGRVELLLAPGTYGVCSAQEGGFRGPRASFEWTANGPLVPTVALELEDDD